MPSRASRVGNSECVEAKAVGSVRTLNIGVDLVREAAGSGRAGNESSSAGGSEAEGAVRLALGGRSVDEAAGVRACRDCARVRLGEAKGALFGDVEFLATWHDGVHAGARGGVDGAGFDGGGRVGELATV